MDKNLLKIVLDTNILFSALVYGGKPQQVLDLIIEDEILGIASSQIIAELIDVLARKTVFSEIRLKQIEEEITNIFKLVYPKKTLKIIADEPDNRVLEAAVEGDCDFIITGDRDLLKLKKYKKIKILTPDEILEKLAEK